MRPYVRSLTLSATIIASLAIAGVICCQDAQPKKNQQWQVMTMRLPQPAGDATRFATGIGGAAIVTECVEYEGKPAIRRTDRVRTRITFAGQSRLIEGTDTFYYSLDGRRLAKTSSMTMAGRTKTKDTKYGPDSVTYKTTKITGEILEGTVKIPKGRSVVRSVDVPLCDVPLKVGVVYDGVSFDDEEFSFFRDEYRVEREEEIDTPRGKEKVFVVTERCDNGSQGTYWLRADHTMVKFEGVDSRGSEFKCTDVPKEEAEKHLKGE